MQTSSKIHFMKNVKQCRDVNRRKGIRTRSGCYRRTAHTLWTAIALLRFVRWYGSKVCNGSHPYIPLHFSRNVFYYLYYYAYGRPRSHLYCQFDVDLSLHFGHCIASVKMSRDVHVGCDPIKNVVYIKVTRRIPPP